MHRTRALWLKFWRALVMMGQLFGELGLELNLGKTKVWCPDGQQQMLPAGVGRYLVSALPVLGSTVSFVRASAGADDADWRVVAATDGTMVTTIPPQPDSGTFTINRGEFKEIISEDSFEIVSSEPVMVAQYLVSQTRTDANIGDPAMIIAPPISQLRDSYQIITPQGYSSNWLTVARPTGTRASRGAARFAPPAPPPPSASGRRRGAPCGRRRS